MAKKILYLVILGSLSFVSCKKAPCPAYGKTVSVQSVK